jgi:hypothetical protein
MLVCVWATTHANTSFSSLKDHESVLVCDTLFIKKLLVSDTIMLERQTFSIEVYDIAHYAYLLKGKEYDLYIKHHEQGYIALKIDHVPNVPLSPQPSLSFKEYLQTYPYCFGFFGILILFVGAYLGISLSKRK